MKKLLSGIVDFRKRIRPSVKDTFAKLALGQKPDCLLINCSDSRVAVNLFASTDPGDLFVVRNVGNMVTPCDVHGTSSGDVSEIAALEFAVKELKVGSIIVCGHSECGAMNALISGRSQLQNPHLKEWLKNADEALQPGRFVIHAQKPFTPQSQVSQRNVLLQIEHLKTYPFIAEQVAAGTLKIYGWWFDIAEAEVYYWDEGAKSFMVIDEIRAERMINRLSQK